MRILHGQSTHKSGQLDIAILKRDGQRALQAGIRSPDGIPETGNTSSLDHRYRAKLRNTNHGRAGKPEHKHKRTRTIHTRQRSLLLHACYSSPKPIKIFRTPDLQKTRGERKRIEGRNSPFNACNRMKTRS